MLEADAGELSERLRLAPFEPLGQFPTASNATLLVRLGDRDPRDLTTITEELGRPVGPADLDPIDLAVYKPVRGEAPLWDFPVGTLHRREVAAYEVSVAAGWDLVPVTVLREDGAFGPGSLQQFVPHDPQLHYFKLLEVGGPDIGVQLRRLVVFDLVIDNADRKGGHVLLEQERWQGDRVEGRVRAIDHGVSFHCQRKLRSVVWDFAGEPFPDQEREALEVLAVALDGPLATRLQGLLMGDELSALRDRVQVANRLSELPHPTGRRPFPWPPL